MLVLAEELEMAVGGANREVGKLFRQPHHAGIGKIHRGVGLPVEQVVEVFHLAPEWSHLQTQTLDELKDTPARQRLFGGEVTGLG